MFPKPEPKLALNTYAYESQPMVKPTGFREYDARWLFEKEINLMGAQALGLGLARLLKELGVRPEVVVAGRATKILIDQIRTIDVSYVAGELVDYLSRDDLAQVEHSLSRYLGLLR